MSLSSLVSKIIPFKHGIKDPNNPRFIFNFDATLNVTHSRTMTLSKYPIERGADITDHSQLQNPTIQVTGYISGSPIKIFQYAGALLAGLPVPGEVAGVIAAGAGGIGALFEAFTPSPDQQAYEYLKYLQSLRTPFSFISDLEVYDDMMLTSIEIPKTQQTGRGLPFNLTLERVTIVESLDISIPSDLVQGATGAVSDLGKKQAESVLAPLKKESILKALFGILNGGVPPKLF